jgi:hypothetical protein
MNVVFDFLTSVPQVTFGRHHMFFSLSSISCDVKSIAAVLHSFLRGDRDVQGDWEGRGDRESPDNLGDQARRCPAVTAGS